MSQRDERSTNSPLDGLILWVIRHAARRAPACVSARLEEEWLADLEARSSVSSRLRFAVGCCWASLVIVNEYPRERVPAATATASASGFITPPEGHFSYFSLRAGTLFLITGLHAALFYVLITSLSHTHASATPPNLQNHALEPVPPAKVPPPALASILKHRTIDVQKLVIDAPPKVVIENEVTTTVVEKPEPPSLPLLPAPPTHVAKSVVGGPDAGFPDTADFYPSLSIRLGEQGLAAVRVCVDPKGRLVSDPTIARGSGNTRLDDAALRLARAGSGHYRASTEDGQPVDSCYSFGIRFQMRK